MPITALSIKKSINARKFIKSEESALKLAIVAGGPESLIPDLLQPAYQDVQWIGADRGTYVLLRRGIQPIKAFGDFDSLSPGERHTVQGSGTSAVVYPPEKDKTDLELALDWACAQKPDVLFLFGVTGGRQDHALAAVHLLHALTKRRILAEIIDQSNCIQLLTPGIYQLERKPEYHYLSFLALSDEVTDLTLRGVKYPLNKAAIIRESSLCISNEVTEETFTVCFTSGLLLMMRCSD